MAEVKVTNSPEKTNPLSAETEMITTRCVIEGAANRLTFLLETWPFENEFPGRPDLREFSLSGGSSWPFLCEGVFAVLCDLERLYWKFDPENSERWIGCRPDERESFACWEPPCDLQWRLYTSLAMLAFVHETICTSIDYPSNLSEAGLLGLRGVIKTSRDALLEGLGMIDGDARPQEETTRTPEVALASAPVEA